MLIFVNCNILNEYYLIGIICFNLIFLEGEKKFDIEELIKEGKYNNLFCF